jgi:hypothetical protein
MENHMKIKQLTLTCLALLILTACQPAAAAPAQPVENSPAPTNTSSPLPTAAPLPSATLKPTPTAPAPVRITAFCTLIGQPARISIPRGAPVIIYWGWSAKTEAQIHDYLESNITTVTLDGKVIAGRQADRIQKNARSGDPEIVIDAEVGILPPGEHKVTYDLKWKKQIFDGTATYGPGGKFVSDHDECQIIVE